VVVRTRRAILRKWLIVIISAVGGVFLVWIGWLSI
jgi:threonine/homoserine/homoserine lactone efflux protein